MTLSDVIAKLDEFAGCKCSISVCSYDDSNKEILCDLSDEVYSYDRIIGQSFTGQDTIKSFDAISVKNGWLNIIEFKNQKIKGTNLNKDLRMKVSEGLHYLEKVILEANFLTAHGIKSRFIFVYSKSKNPIESNHKDIINDYFIEQAGLRYSRYISDRYDKKWQYVDESISLDNEEFINNKDLYV